eukprot:gene1945-2380_t
MSLSLMIIVVLITISTSTISADTQTVNFVNFGAACQSANNGCSILNPDYWDRPNVLSNPSIYVFNIDLSQNNDTLDLIIDSTFNPNSFLVVGGRTTALKIQKDLLVTQVLNLTNVAADFSQGTIVDASTVILEGGTNLFLGHNSTLGTIDQGPGGNLPQDTKLVLGVNAQLSLYDVSAVYVVDITSLGQLNLHDNSSITVNGSAILGGGTMMAANSRLHTYGSLTFSDTSDLNLLGLLVTDGGFSICGGCSATLYFLNTGPLTIPQKSTLTLAANGQLFAKTIDLGGDIIVSTSSSMYYLSNQMTTLPDSAKGVITLQTGSNLTLANVEITNRNLVTQGPNVAVFVEQNVIFSGGDLTLNGTVRVLGGGTLRVFANLTLEKCIKNVGAGSTTYISNYLFCLNSEFDIVKNGRLILVGNAIVYCSKTNNYGTIISQTLAQIRRGHINSTGTIIIEPGSSIDIDGFVDLFPSSILRINGMAPNTSYYALQVLDGLTLDGEFYYNLTTPPSNLNIDYKLLSSTIEIMRNFSSVQPDPYLSNYEFKTIFSPATRPLTMEVVLYGYKGSPSKASRVAGIILGILIPLIFIGVIVTVIYYIRRRNKAYEFYSRIQ